LQLGHDTIFVTLGQCWCRQHGSKLCIVPVQFAERAQGLRSRVQGRRLNSSRILNINSSCVSLTGSRSPA
jgi:hypothetical protein